MTACSGLRTWTQPAEFLRAFSAPFVQSEARRSWS
jgi:hypothetical protein